MGGLRLALTLFTVAPLHVPRVDRPAARSAMAWAPLVGVVLGCVLACFALTLRSAGAAPLVAAAATVGLLALITRALHLDGLADTTDALGSYRSAEQALEIMKKPDIGPFGVVAIVLVLLVDAAALTTILSRPWPDVVAQLALTLAAGRLAATIACRRGLPAARPDGLGALVAQTQPLPVVAALTVLIAAAGYLADPIRGPLAVLLPAAVTWALTAHARRRFGGLTGDVIGASVELSTMTALLVLSTVSAPILES